jgi:hypothetical protein
LDEEGENLLERRELRREREERVLSVNQHDRLFVVVVVLRGGGR